MQGEKVKEFEGGREGNSRKKSKNICKTIVVEVILQCFWSKQFKYKK